MALQAVIFDCFGVLLGDALLSEQASLRAAGRGDEADRLGELMRQMDKGLLTLEQTHQQESELLGVSEAELSVLLSRGEVLNESLLPVIRGLRTRYKTALMSNIGARSQIEQRLPAGLLDELFDVVIASGEVGVIKPDPRIYEITLQQLGVEASQALMTDDRPRFTEGAEAVGMRAILFKDTAQFVHDFAIVEAQLGA